MNLKMMPLKPDPPFDFDLSAAIFSEGDAQIRRYEKGKFWQVIRVNNKLILITVTATGTVEEPELSVNLGSDNEISNADAQKAVEIIRTIFNMDIDLDSFYEDVRNDRIISELALKLRGLKSPTTVSVFESLIDSIIEQQISLNVAHSLERNLIRSFGDTLDLDGEVYYAFPSPKKLASAPIEKIRKCGLSLKKAEYIKEISRIVAEKELDLEKFKKYENIRDIISELDKIRGIGVWTAELTVVRGMQKFEAIPADDLGVRRCISHYYRDDKKISGEDVRKIAENWGKWKGLASFYLIVAERNRINY